MFNLHLLWKAFQQRPSHFEILALSGFHLSRTTPSTTFFFFPVSLFYLKDHEHRLPEWMKLANQPFCEVSEN